MSLYLGSINMHEVAIVQRVFSLSSHLGVAWHCGSVVSARRLWSRCDNTFTLQCQSGLDPDFP